MMKLEIVVVMLVVILVSRCSGFGNGAPPTACATMFPGHKVDAQTTDPPYTFTVSPTSYTPLGTLQVTVAGTGTQMYAGVFVQARVANCTGSSNDAPQGSFTLGGETGLKLATCSDTMSAVTHTSTAPKTTKTFTWTAPDTDVGTIYFRATVAQSKNVFWTQLSSEFVTSPANNANPVKCPTVNTTLTPATEPVTVKATEPVTEPVTVNATESTVAATTMGVSPIDTSILLTVFCAVISLLGFC